jgi:D-arabinose 1-dehydrogenase-like Zn-dependent alcohol dehydrogenase
VVDFVGTTDIASFLLGVLRKGGRLILVGLYGGEIPLSLVTTIQRALTIQGSHLGSLSELKQVVMLAREGKLQPIPIQKRPLSEVSFALDELKAGAVVGRVVVEM